MFKSEKWLSIDEISGVQILKTHKRVAPSLLYNNYLIIVTRLLQEWKKNVNNLLAKIEFKLWQ
jgi:hypothetical protein